MAGMSWSVFQEEYPKYSKNAYKAYKKYPELESVLNRYPNNAIVRVVKATEEVVKNIKNELNKRTDMVKTVWYTYKSAVSVETGKQIRENERTITIVYMEYTIDERVPNLSQIVVYDCNNKLGGLNMEMTDRELKIARDFFERVIICGYYGVYYTGDGGTTKGIMDIGMEEYVKKNPKRDFCFGFMATLESIQSGVDIDCKDKALTVGIHDGSQDKEGYVTIGLNNLEDTKVRLYYNGEELSTDSEKYVEMWNWLFSELEGTLI